VKYGPFLTAWRRASRLHNDFMQKIAEKSRDWRPGLLPLPEKGDEIVPIPGTKHRKYLEENGATEALRLNSAEISALDDAMAPGKVSGNTMPIGSWQRLIAERSNKVSV
jgi:diketogulonate reductase-like aldo/keto reductase